MSKNITPIEKPELGDRTQYIGASDMGALLGLDEYRQPMDLYLEKTGQVEKVVDSEAAHWGNVLEDPIAREYGRRENLRVARISKDFATPDGRFRCHLDRMVGTGKDRRPLEIKNVSLYMSSGWGEQHTDQIPPAYLAQVHAQLALTGYAYSDVAALIGGNELRVYRVHRSEDWCGVIFQNVHAFWNAVETKEPPPIMFRHRSTPAVIKILCPGTSGETVTLPEEAEHWHHVLKVAKEEVKNSQVVADECIRRLTMMMGDATTGLLPESKGGYRRIFTKAVEIEAHTRQASISTRYSANYKG